MTFCVEIQVGIIEKWR